MNKSNSETAASLVMSKWALPAYIASFGILLGMLLYAYRYISTIPENTEKHILIIGVWTIAYVMLSTSIYATTKLSLIGSVERKEELLSKLKGWLKVSLFVLIFGSPLLAMLIAVSEFPTKNLDLILAYAKYLLSFTSPSCFILILIATLFFTFEGQK